MFDRFDKDKTILLNVDGKNVSVSVETHGYKDGHSAYLVVNSVGDLENGILNTDSRNAALKRTHKALNAVKEGVGGEYTHYIPVSGVGHAVQSQEFTSRDQMNAFVAKVFETAQKLKTSQALNPKADYIPDWERTAKEELAHAQFVRVEDLETLHPSGAGPVQRPGFEQARISMQTTADAQALADSINRLVLENDIPGTVARVRYQNVFVDMQHCEAHDKLKQAVPALKPTRQWDEHALDNVPDERFLRDMKPHAKLAPAL